VHISALQARMTELQRYCSCLEGSQNNGRYSVSSNKAITCNDQIKGVQSEQLAYFREKNKELEERVDSNIRLNKELKEKLEKLANNNCEDTN
jgi:hypothetical protein